MSSFIINKKEYIKAAGLMHGIERTSRYPHTWFLNHVKEMFEECYELNVKSVSKQYGVRYKAEEESYENLFREYSRKGEYIWRGFNEKVSKLKLRYILLNFFSCVDYQIEDKKMSERVASIFWDCTYKLVRNDIIEQEDLDWDIIKLPA